MMKTLILAALAAMIGVGAANITAASPAFSPSQQNSASDWANG